MKAIDCLDAQLVVVKELFEAISSQVDAKGSPFPVVSRSFGQEIRQENRRRVRGPEIMDDCFQLGLRTYDLLQRCVVIVRAFVISTMFWSSMPLSS